MICSREHYIGWLKDGTVNIRPGTYLFACPELDMFKFYSSAEFEVFKTNLKERTHNEN